MTWTEIRAKCRRESDYIITLFITNELSLLLTRGLAATRATPNQVTAASIACAALCGVCYAFGWLLAGSLLLFFSHVLDCTDGNLARVKELFSPLGKWLDMIGDRAGECFIFLGAAVFFISGGESGFWVVSALLDAQLLLLYYYMVDMSLALGISKPKQSLGSLRFKGVHVKWGVMEPVIYGFILLAPLGLIKVQVVLVFCLAVSGLGYQAYKKFSREKEKI